MDLALDGVLWGAFGTTGQRCTATSRLLLHDEIHDAFVERLVERARELKLGDGLEDGVEVGPLINEPAREKVERYVEIGRGEAELVLGGAAARGRGVDDGFFFQPTIFTGVRPARGWPPRRSSARCSR
jgi:alpha-ketoglutaric semialdehyde dehydrogenase